MRAVNLIPAAQRGGASVGAGRSEGGVYALLALLAGVAVLAALYGHARHEISSRRGQAASLTAQAQQAQAAASQLAPFASFVALREQRAQAVSQLVASRFDWANVFREFGRVLPPTTTISALSGTVGSSATTGSSTTSSTTSSSSTSASKAAATVSSATPPGSVPTFTLTGCATSQAAVAKTIQRLRLIDGVSDVTLQSSTATAVPGATGSAAPVGSNGCAGSDPVFSIAVTFEALPQASSASAATTVDASVPSGGAR